MIMEARKYGLNSDILAFPDMNEKIDKSKKKTLA